MDPSTTEKNVGTSLTMTQKQITSVNNNKRVDILPATINELKKEKKTKKKKADIDMPLHC